MRRSGTASCSLQTTICAIHERRSTPRRYRPVARDAFRYEPGEPSKKVATLAKKIIIVSDADDPGSNLAKMACRLQSCLDGQTSVINLREINIRGGCLGCCQCGLDNECVYQDSDDVHAVYGKLTAADVVIVAGSVRDRYLSARWKVFLDRSFFMNHVPVFAGKQMGYLVEGPLSQLATLRQVLDAYVECQQANLVGMVSDECSTSPGTRPVLGQPCRPHDRLCRQRLHAAAKFPQCGRQETYPGRGLGQATIRLPTRPSVLQDARWVRFPEKEPQDEDRRDAVYRALDDPRFSPRFSQADSGRDD